MTRRFTAVLFVALLLAMPLCAQTNKGSISGTVFDQSGAVLPGATVTITNIGTGHKLVVQASEKGVYLAPNLDPVDYRVDVDMPGFRKAIVARRAFRPAQVSRFSGSKSAISVIAQNR